MMPMCVRALSVRFFPLAAAIPFVFLLPPVALAAHVHALFDLAAPAACPFPSDRFTVADPRQNTGLRVNLPKPDCSAWRSDCEDIDVLNALDGFNMQPRLSIPFDGPLDLKTVSSSTIFLIRLGSTLPGGGRGPQVVGINQVVWDPLTNTLYARSDESLDQHTRYALVVTRGVRDESGAAIEASDAFRRFRQTVHGRYKQDLLDAIRTARRAGGSEDDIAVACVFTTQSFSHIIERIRGAVRRAPTPRLDFGVGPGGARAVFDAARVQSVTNNAHERVGGPLTPQPRPNAVPNMSVIAGAVGTVAFGKLRALDFTTHLSGHIAPIPTRTGRLRPTGSLDVAFDLFLPSGTPPAGGWPVAMFGHGSSSSKDFGFPTSAVLASHGVAVISLDAMGHGTGPLTTMTVTRADGSSMTFAAPGLGYDEDGDGEIEAFEPRDAARPHAIYETSGPLLQTAALYMQLVRAIQAGVDVDGDGRPDLDASRIYYYGHSIGGMYGMFSFAYEPAIRAAVFVVPPGTLVDSRRLSLFRPLVGQFLAARTPPLLNSEFGLKNIDGLKVGEPFFNENLPLRNQPPVVNTVPGAGDIQRVIDRVIWVTQIANPVAIAPFLRRSPPAGVRARPFVLQFARSDASVANLTTTQIIRAGRCADRVLFYRHDLNFGKEGVPANSHLYLSAVRAEPNYSRVALGAQQQIATFFESDGREVIHPEPAELWERPISSPLPEDTFYLPRPR